MERPADWARLREAVGKHPVLLAGDSAKRRSPAPATTTSRSLVNKPPESPVFERLTQALLESVANEFVPPGATIVAVYSGFEPTVIDTISIIRLGEHLGQLTMRDLRELKTRIPFDTLKIVVDLAVDIGREGREGQAGRHAVGRRRPSQGAQLLPADGLRSGPRLQPHRAQSRRREGPRRRQGNRPDRRRVRRVERRDVVAAGQHIAAPRASDLTLPKGFGSRHWAAAEISRATSAIAIVVSQSSGTVRLFQNGEVDAPHRTLPPPHEVDRVRRRTIAAADRHIARPFRPGVRSPTRNGSAI